MTPTQSDLEEAEKIVAEIQEWFTESFPDHVVATIALALSQAEKRGAEKATEAAAKVAETYTHYRDVSDSLSHAHGIVEWTCAFCADAIAAAIRGAK